ncbi:MAG TPA: signal peptide peptidase SppA [Candidatus Polarisedimenticolia bacterium]|nr:signal peptide peptidase SppA [Candidatus Polarisedimenticolia bacterium]
MTRGAKGCLLAAGAILVLLVVVAIAVMMAGGVPAGTVVQITLAGDILEEKEDSLQAMLFQGDAVLLRDIINAIDRARADDRVNGLMVVLKPFSMGLGKVQEIRDAVLAFRESGKWAAVYSDTIGEFSGGNAMYYLATAFDEIYLAPPGDVNVYGLLSVTPFLRGTLDKLGIYPDFDSIGKYKNAKDIYTEKEMTAAHREATLAYLNDWHDQIAEGIAKGRSLDRDAVAGLINGGPYTGAEALQKGLVDKLAYYDEFLDALEERNGGELDPLGYKEYMEKRGGSSGRSRIAVITGTGIIVTGKSSAEPGGAVVMGSDTITRAFREAREDSGIKAIVFRVDSPGGSAVASDVIWRETQLARKDKPVVISMSDVAASGGYYVSAGSTRIVSQPGTITGSIGVVGGKMVTTGLYDWIGLNREAIGTADHSTYFYDGTKYTAEEKEIYWKFMNKIYDQFTGLVAQGRGMTREAVDAIGQGRVWTGRRAKELGLVDELGGMREAIRIAKKEAGIPEDETVRLVYLPQKRSFVQNLLWPEENSSAARLPREMSRVMQDLSRAAILSREPVWLLSETPALP